MERSFFFKSQRAERKGTSPVVRKYRSGRLQSISSLLPEVLEKMEARAKQNPQQVLSAWPGIVGKTIANKTRAQRFVSGILYVYVVHSTLHSLLVEHEKPRLLELLRAQFPSVEIRDLVFRIG